MKRKDLFVKLVTKSIDFTLEKGSEFAEAFQQSALPSREMRAEQPYTKKPKRKRKEKSLLKGLSLPPGAVQPETKFKSKCTGCGDCVFSCPYNAIFPVYDAELGKNLPFMDMNSNACRMCSDWPCIQACKFDALKPFKSGEASKFGQAKGIFEYCINKNTDEKTCNVCQEACPIEKTVRFRKNQPVFGRSCTGCGLCVQSCPTFPKAIRIK